MGSKQFGKEMLQVIMLAKNPAQVQEELANFLELLRNCAKDPLFVATYREAYATFHFVSDKAGRTYQEQVQNACEMYQVVTDAARATFQDALKNAKDTYNNDCREAEGGTYSEKMALRSSAYSKDQSVRSVAHKALQKELSAAYSESERIKTAVYRTKEAALARARFDMNRTIAMLLTDFGVTVPKDWDLFETVIPSKSVPVPESKWSLRKLFQ